MSLYFIAAVYNEQDEIQDLLQHVHPLVDGWRIVDDGSTDDTVAILDAWFTDGAEEFRWQYQYDVLDHTGLPETVKNHAVQMVPDGSWVLMLDADERLSSKAIEGIRSFLAGEESNSYDYIYFNQLEIIDGQAVRAFQKCKLFRKEAITFPLNNIHADDQFEGRGIYKADWVVLHRKTTSKQINREKEYLATYKKLLEDGHIDEGRYNWLVNLHHYVKE